MATVVTAWDYAVWGLLGGFAVDGLEFGGGGRRVGGRPWHQLGEPGPLPLAVPVLIRLAVSTGRAAAVGTLAASAPEPGMPAQTEHAQGGGA
jgi:hypothetical protein